MKMSCRYCGIVDKPHRCPHNKVKTDYTRADKKIYRTFRWQCIRDNVLDNYNHICLWSLYVDAEIKPADTVHHIIEVLDNEELAYEYENLIPLEFYNHNVVHALYKNNKHKVQSLLRKMCSDYQKGDRTLGKYKGYKL